MFTLRKAILVSSAFAFLGLTTAVPTHADALQLFSQSQLTPGFTQAMYPGAPNDLFATVIINSGDNTLTFTDAGNRFLRFDQVQPPHCCWGGNFALGDRLLYALHAAPITIDFAAGITEFGFQAQGGQSGGEGFIFDIFNGTTLIMSFDVIGISDSNADNSAPFLGARARGGDVFTRIVIRGGSTASPNDFAINEIKFNNAPRQPVPEPVTITLLGIGLAGTALKVRHRRKRGSL